MAVSSVCTNNQLIYSICFKIFSQLHCKVNIGMDFEPTASMPLSKSSKSRKHSTSLLCMKTRKVSIFQGFVRRTHSTAAMTWIYPVPNPVSWLTRILNSYCCLNLLSCDKIKYTDPTPSPSSQLVSNEKQGSRLQLSCCHTVCLCAGPLLAEIVLLPCCVPMCGNSVSCNCPAPMLCTRARNLCKLQLCYPELSSSCLSS